MKLYEMIFEMPMFKNFSEREKKSLPKSSIHSLSLIGAK